MTIEKVLVIGAGTMGAGIAQVCLQAGKKVRLFDLDESRVVAAGKQIRSGLEKLKASGKWGADIDLDEFLLDSLTLSAEALGEEQDLAIEAIIEKEEVKAGLYARVEPILTTNGILATNTSSLSITKLANTVRRAERFAGLHFFNPATHMPLVEVISGDQTSKETMTQLYDFVKEIRKTPVRASDSPGFIVNRVARPYYAEALYLHDTQGADMAAIDAAMEAHGFKLGPFKLMDLIGHDVNYSVTSLVYAGLGKPTRFTPSDTQKNLVTKGLLGKKSGEGFYKL